MWIRLSGTTSSSWLTELPTVASHRNYWWPAYELPGQTSVPEALSPDKFYKVVVCRSALIRHIAREEPVSFKTSHHSHQNLRLKKTLLKKTKRHSVQEEIKVKRWKSALKWWKALLFSTFKFTIYQFRHLKHLFTVDC